ncbi:MAG TPA: AAA family ATPase, partial [Thermomicrobiales bacterium]|nr:AAA family ATPase [Thermomicrobiales bacterium]
MTILLKRLDIHGFKSFASATPFVFDRGITAIIGPNGSGKSNVAEALRWVLGEQGHANLRSRRTDDVIFAGSDKRAQQALAEVVLTLDNADGDLPLPFSEITVTRRAFRGGENQYLINGSRVRLKDVQQLVAPIGQSYTIIGQGLVDAALSQRPEERRGLFEHAAGIAGLRLRANEAERGLTEASANSTRLRDILSELEPRVRSLERQARMAREYGAVRDRLHDLQRRHYRALWSESAARVTTEREALDAADDAFAERERAHTVAAQRLAELRAQDRRLSDELAALTQRAADRDRAASDARHRLELLDARTRSSEQRAADIRERCAELERDRAAASAVADELTAERKRLTSAVAALERQLSDRDAALAEARRERDALRLALGQADQRELTLARGLAEREGTLAGL